VVSFGICPDWPGGLVKILTDSAASVPPWAVDELGVVVVPLTLVVGGLVYDDGDLSPEDLIDLASGTAVSTSSPSPGAFVKAIDEVRGLGEDVLVLTVSRRMSATFEAARQAGGYFEPGSVRVVDTGTAAGGQGLVVIDAARAAAAGATMTQVAERAEWLSSQVRLVAALENMDHLARSGRVPGAAAWAGRAAGLRPVFELSDKQIKPRRPALSEHAAFDRMVSSVLADRRDDARLQFAVLYSGPSDPAREMESRITSQVPTSAHFYAPFSSVMVAHTGPGLTGVAWWWDYEPTGGASS
jgi:DegV family protein with EDD domain